MPQSAPPLADRGHSHHDPPIPPTAYVLSDSHVTAVRVWMQNLFDDGVFVVADEELEGERMILKLAIPELEGCLVECDVTHRSRYDRIRVNGTEDTLCAFGLRFRRVHRETDVHETLLAAFGLAELSPPEPLPAPRVRREESLVPLLSAVGLVVVYVSQYPW